MVGQAGSDYREILLFLEHEGLIARDEMTVFVAEVIEETFHTKTQMGSNLVDDAAADHKAGVVVAMAEAEGTIVDGDHYEIVVCVDESDASCTVEQPIT